MLKSQSAANCLKAISPVGCNQVVLIVRVSIKNLTPEERGLMVYDIVLEVIEAYSVWIFLIQSASIGIQQQGVTIVDVPAKFIGENLFQGIRLKKSITTVKNLYIIPIGMCNAFVYGIVDAIVRLADPESEAVGIMFNQLFTAICAAAINYNPFIVDE